MSAATAQAHDRGGTSWFLRNVLLRYGMVWALIILAVAANVMYPGFFAWGNVSNILFQNSPVGLVAVAMTFVLIAGGFDLSVGAIFAMGAVVFATLSNHASIPIAFGITVIVGVIAGSINGFIITRLDVNPFVATLGTASMFGGLVYIFSNSAPVLSSNEDFGTFGTGEILGLPIVVWVLLGAVVVGGVVLARSVYGRSVYQVGGNAEAARLAGIRVKLVKASTYALTGASASVAGMMLASRVGVGQADFGAAITLDAIAIVVIGGTSLMGGEGAIWRTVVGLLLLGTLSNLFDSLGWQSPTQQVVKGAIVIAAVSLDALSRRRA